MDLEHLIQFLESQDPGIIVPMGFSNPHSYRVSYKELAFSPVENTSTGEMITAAQYALGRTFEGYKGSKYKMDKHTPVHLAEYGDLGEEIGPTLLKYMVGIY